MTKKDFTFGKENFFLMAISVALIIIGFCLMSGGGATNSTDFNPEIFDAQRIVVAPTVALAGFIMMIAAIIYKPKQ